MNNMNDEFSSSKRLIREPASWHIKRERIRAAIRVVADKKKKAREALDKLLEELGEEFIQAMSGPGDQEKRKALSVLMWLCVVLDVPLQIGLMSGVLPGVPSFFIGCIGLVLAFVLARGTQAITFLSVFDPTRPRHSARLCLLLAGVSGFFVLLSGSFVMYARSASEESISLGFVHWLGLATWILAETLPLTSGFCGACNQIFSIGGNIQEKVQAFDRELSECERFESWLADELASLREREAREEKEKGKRDEQSKKLQEELGEEEEPPTEPKPKRGRPRKSPLNLVPTTGLLLALLASPALAEQKVCTYFLDATPLSKRDREIAIEKAQKTIPTVLEGQGCTRLRVSWFSDRGAFSAYAEYEVPRPPLQVACEEVVVQAKGTTGMLANLGNIQGALKREAKVQCEGDKERDAARYDKELRELVKAVSPSFGGPPPIDHVPCSGIWEILDRSLETGVFPVVVTDGEETCRGDWRKAPPRGGKAVMVLVPPLTRVGEGAKSGRVLEQETLARGKEWKRVFPLLVTVPFNELSVDFWKTVGGGDGPAR